jgi:hypothetical protein
MKRLFPLLLMVLLANGLSAQIPVLTAAVHNPVVGDSLERIYFDTTGFIPGPAGPNQIFQFGNLSLVGDTFSSVMELDANAPNPVIALFIDPNFSTFPFAEAFLPTTDSLSLYGKSYPAIEGDSYQRDNPSIKLPFPMTYGDQASDSYQGERLFYFLTEPFSGTIQVEADAYGILQLPTDTFVDVLRVHSLDNMTIGQPGNTRTIIEECWDYYSASHRYPIISNCVGGPDGGGAFTARLLNPTATAVTHEELPSIKLYPNPMNDVFRVLASEHGTLQLFDMQGRTLSTFTVGIGNNAFTVANLPTGLYLAKFEGETYQRQRMVIKK